MKLLSASIATVGAAIYFAVAPVSANTTMTSQSYPAEQAAPASDPQAKPAEEHAGQDRDGNVVTDAWISTKIHADFVNEKLLEGSDIDVDTTAHVVTLSGTVGSAAGRARAVEIATKTNGVTRVVDRLSVAADARTADREGYGEQLGREADDVGERAESAAESAGDAVEQGAERSGNVITDAWITTRIHADYVNENVLEDSDIDVDTQSKVVTLTGTVPSQAGRARAVEIATKTDGVARVVDRLTIAPRTSGANDVDAGDRMGGEAREAGNDIESAAESAGDSVERGAESAGSAVTDAWITTKVHGDFTNERLLEGSDIDVDTNNKVVTLTGTVESEAARARAVEIATKTEGVARVVDKMTISAR